MLFPLFLSDPAKLILLRGEEARTTQDALLYRKINRYMPEIHENSCGRLSAELCRTLAVCEEKSNGPRIL